MSSDKSQITCPTVLLDDFPTSEDAFRHGEIARAIAHMVQTEPGGRAIAVTGSWGSGKSTVVELLRQALEHQQVEIKVVIFDSWAHQGDPLRRTFIEYLYSQLKDWISDQNKWQKKIDVLASRLVESTTRTRPELTFLGMLGASSVLLAPAAGVFIGALKDSLRDHPRILIALLVAASSPVVFAVAVFIVWLGGNAVKRLKARLKKRDMPERSGFPSLIYSSTENKVVTESNRTPEPTSLEFERAYCELLEDAIGTRKRRLLLVVDNLDRLQPEEARVMWATLKTFLDESLRHQVWHKNVWVAVPFDERAVRKIFNETEKGRRSAGDEFIRKTFQGFFRVAPALETNWEKYLSKQLSLALPNHHEDEFKTIFWIYEALKEPQSIPTPRELKLFVNSLGCLHRQWEDDISITVQAAFLLSLESHPGNFPELLQSSSQNDDLLPTAVKRRLKESWQRDFAALYYNVDLDRALEALLSTPISLALESGSADHLIQLEKSPGFEHVLERLVVQRLNSGSSVEQAIIINAALAVGAFSEVETSHRFTFNMLLDRMNEVKTWNAPDVNVGRALISVMRRSSELHCSYLLRAYISSQPSHGGKELSGWTDGLASVLEHLVEQHSNAVGPVSITEADLFVRVVDRLRVKEKNALMRLVEPTDSSAVLRQFANNMVGDMTALVWHLHLIKALRPIHPDWEWGELVPSLGSVIIADSQEASVIAVATDLLIELDDRSDPFRVRLSTLLDCDSGFLSISRIDSAEYTKRHDFLVLCLIASEATLPLGRTVHGYVSPATTDANRIRVTIGSLVAGKVDAPRSLIEAAQQFLPLSGWVAVSKRDSSRLSFLVAVAEASIEADGSSKYFLAGDLVRNVSLWDAHLSAEKWKALVGHLAATGELHRALSTVDVDSSHDVLLLWALRAKSTKTLRTTARELLLGLGEDEWYADLSEDGIACGLAALLAEDAQLGPPLGAALLRHARGALDDSDLYKAVEAPGQILAALDATERSAFRQGFVAAFAGQESNLSDLLEKWGTVLTQSLLDVGPQNANDRLLGIIAGLDSEECRWLESFLREWGTASSYAAKFRKAARNKIKEVRGVTQTLSPSEEESLNSLLKVLKQL